MWLYHLFLFGLRRLLCDLRPDISIASFSTAVHAPRKLEGGGPNFRQSTSFWYMFLNSKMLFRSGFVFSRIHTTELIFYQLLLSQGWKKSETYLDCLRYTQLLFYLAKVMVHTTSAWFEHISFPKTGHAVDTQDFFCFKIATNSLFFFFSLERRETGLLPGENYMFVCAIILFFENRFIFLACLPQPAS